MYSSGPARDFVMVGMPDVAVRESRERIKSALINSGFGRADVKVPVTFVRVEAYVVPKKSLTSAATERVDTRVLQVVSAFHQPETFRLYAGQEYISRQSRCLIRPLSSCGAKDRPWEVNHDPSTCNDCSGASEAARYFANSRHNSQTRASI